MNALLAAAGSRGDMQPMLALALRLRQRGHEVRICCSPDGAGLFEARGFQVTPAGLDVRAYLTENAAAAHDDPLGTFRELTGLIDGLARDFTEALVPMKDGIDVVVGSGLIFPGPSVAALAGVPYRIAVYSPLLLPSAAHPPLTVPWQRLPGWINRLLWWSQNRVFDRFGRRSLNPRRAALGLPPVRDFYRHVLPPGGLMIAAEPALAPCPTDYDPDPFQPGFWMLPEQGPEALDEGLLSFVEAEPTVFIGFGSMPDPDPAATTALIVEGVARAGVRALIHRGWAGLGGGESGRDLPANCQVIGPTPHSALFPLLAGVVHHGGSGTTATAARAGAPQVAVPHLLDQFYWGDRIHQAGLGPPAVRRGRLTPAKLAALLRELVERDGYREAAAGLSATMRARDGVGAAVEALERAVAAGAKGR